MSPYIVFPLVLAGLNGIRLLATHPVSFRAAGMNARSAVSGILISGYAGTFEELVCRWLCQPLFMAFVDVWVGMFSFLPFDGLLQLFGLRLSLPVALYPLEALGGILSLLTLGKLDAAIAIISKDRAYRYGVYLAELFFSLGHGLTQGPLGVLIKPLGSVVERQLSSAKLQNYCPLRVQSVSSSQVLQHVVPDYASYRPGLGCMHAVPCSDLVTVHSCGRLTGS